MRVAAYDLLKTYNKKAIYDHVDSSAMPFGRNTKVLTWVRTAPEARSTAALRGQAKPSQA